MAIDNFAVVIHLPQPAFRIVLRRGHDHDVFDALAHPGPDVETVSNHDVAPFGCCTNPGILPTLVACNRCATVGIAVVRK